MKKVFVRALCVILASIVVFTGCNPLRKDEKNTENSLQWNQNLEMWKTKVPNQLGKKISAVASDGYSIDADLYLSDEMEDYEVDIVKISRHIYENPDEVLKKCIEFAGLEAPSNIEVYEDASLYEDGTSSLSAVEFLGEDTIAGASGMNVTIATPFFYEYSDWGLLDWNGRMQIYEMPSEMMMQSCEVDWSSEEKILDIKNQLESILEIGFLDEYLLEVCTLERLESMLEYEKTFYLSKGMELDSQERWSVAEMDEGSVLWLFQGYDGIPYLYDEPEYSITGASYPTSSYCTIVSNKEGVEGLYITGMYDVKEVVETVQIISFGELIEKHMESISGTATQVVRVGLYYLPYYSGEGVDFIAKPVWYIQTEQLDELGYPHRQGVLYDAVTGEEIPWY